MDGPGEAAKWKLCLKVAAARCVWIMAAAADLAVRTRMP